ncbi:MAG: DUF1501 domain-containing protein, partial [Verrucomicrobiota bacterium]
MNPGDAFCGRVERRRFLADFGMGFAGLALGALLTPASRTRAADPVAPAAAPDGGAHFPPKARSVIWIFLSGGYSHIETF